MRTYYFEARKILWDRAYQNFEFPQTFPARVRVRAESEEEALKLARKKIYDKYYGTGVLIDMDSVHLARHYDTCVDWSYGYGDERITGDTERVPDLEGSAKIR